MSDLDHLAESDDFAQRSKEFVEWFRNAEGTRLSDKIELADLRHKGAGRGVGKSFDDPGVLSTLLTLPSCYPGYCRR